MTPTPVKAFAIALRVMIALLTSTYFQPDEYFQSLEPAHRIAFGYGHLTWEWQARPPIRSIFFPAVFVPVYWFLKITKLDDTVLLLLAPKVVQGLLASLTDISIYNLAEVTIGQPYAYLTTMMSLSSIFHAQALSRTLSNSLETSLSTLGLSYWPWNSVKPSHTFIMSLVPAALACMVRPTNSILWVFLVLELSWRLRGNPRGLTRLWVQTVLVGLSSCTILLFVDTWYYGEYIFTPLSFLQANLSPISSFYGTSPWHFYLSQGIPVLCDIYTPFFLLAAWKTYRSTFPALKRLLALISWTFLVYSLAPHKEWRFIHPLLPAMQVLTAKYLKDAFLPKNISNLYDLPKRWRRGLALIISIVFPLIIFIQSHAQIAVMYHLRSISQENLKSVGLLMPCHSTPWQAYLHREQLGSNSFWALGCEPPLRRQHVHEYEDQSDVFYKSPIRYLKERFPLRVDPNFPPSPFPSSIPGSRTQNMDQDDWRHSWPSHLVFFGALLDADEVRSFLEGLGYREEWQVWNGFEQDKRRRGGIQVWTWQE